MEDRFRIYDCLNHEWAKDEVSISRRGDMYRIKKGMLGKEYIELMSDVQYVYQYNTLCMDRYGNNVFEGDICRIEGEQFNATGIVVYSGMNAAYYLFCDDGSYYALEPMLTASMSVIGNIFDNQDVLENILLNTNHLEEDDSMIDMSKLKNL